MASINHEHLIYEMLELLLSQMNSKACKDQIFLLMHEPQTAELCYSLLVDRKYSHRLHAIALKVSSFPSNWKSILRIENLNYSS